MSLSASEEQKMFNALLEERGFNFNHPNPTLAWEVFREYVQSPNDNLTTSQIGFESLHVWDCDDILWLSFVRDIEMETHGFSVGCLMSRNVPEELTRVSESIYWSSAQEESQAELGLSWTLKMFFEMVEATEEFKMCMKLSGWAWKVWVLDSRS